MKNRIIIPLLLTVFLSACTRNVFRKTNKVYRQKAKDFGKMYRQVNLLDPTAYRNPDRWVGTTNFGVRKPNLVVIHHTAQQSCEQTLKTFTDPARVVSSHYLICEDGTVYQLLNDLFRGHHAGAGMWGNITDVNSESIGIEIDNDGFEPFTEEQMLSLEALLTRLREKYKIPAANFIGHSDLAPTRKVDPSVYFDWKRLADKGFGQWYEDTISLNVPPAFDPVIGLKVIGYDVRDTTAAIVAFKRKYLDIERDSTLSAQDTKVLYSLVLKSLRP